MENIEIKNQLREKYLADSKDIIVAIYYIDNVEHQITAFASEDHRQAYIRSISK
jgi:hypothetical protein